MPFGFDWGGWNAMVALNTILANQRGDTKTASALTAGQLASDVVGMQNTSSGNELSKAGNFASSHAAAIGAAVGTAVGGAVGTVLLPGIGTASGAQMGASLGGAVGEASTGESDIRKLATVAALSGLGANVGGTLGSTPTVATASGLTAAGAAAGAAYGAQIVSQDEVNAEGGPTTAAEPTQTATGPGFSDIMKTDEQQAQENIQRRQQRLASGRKGTILTGTRGTQNSGTAYQRKTLLGS